MRWPTFTIMSALGEAPSGSPFMSGLVSFSTIISHHLCRSGRFGRFHDPLPLYRPPHRLRPVSAKARSLKNALRICRHRACADGHALHGPGARASMPDNLRWEEDAIAVPGETGISARLATGPPDCPRHAPSHTAKRYAFFQRSGIVQSRAAPTSPTRPASSGPAATRSRRDRSVPGRVIPSDALPSPVARQKPQCRADDDWRHRDQPGGRVQAPCDRTDDRARETGWDRPEESTEFKGSSSSAHERPLPASVSQPAIGTLCMKCAEWLKGQGLAREGE